MKPACSLDLMRPAGQNGAGLVGSLKEAVQRGCINRGTLPSVFHLYLEDPRPDPNFLTAKCGAQCHRHGGPELTSPAVSEAGTGEHVYFSDSVECEIVEFEFVRIVILSQIDEARRWARKLCSATRARRLRSRDLSRSRARCRFHAPLIHFRDRQQRSIWFPNGCPPAKFPRRFATLSSIASGALANQEG